MIGEQRRCVAVLLDRYARLMWAADINLQPQIMTGSYESELKDGMGIKNFHSEWGGEVRSHKSLKTHQMPGLSWRSRSCPLMIGSLRMDGKNQKWTASNCQDCLQKSCLSDSFICLIRPHRRDLWNHHVFKFPSGSEGSGDSCALHLAYGNQNLTHDPEKLTCSDCTLAQKSERQDKLETSIHWVVSTWL